MFFHTQKVFLLNFSQHELLDVYQILLHKHTHLTLVLLRVFSQTYFPKVGCCNPLWIINTEGHITLNLLPVYRYGHPLSIDTKISTNH